MAEQSSAPATGATAAPAQGAAAPPAPGQTPATPPQQQGTPPQGGQGGQGEPQLGDAGQRALAAERASVKELKAKLKELEPLAERARELDEAGKSEQQKLMEKLQAAEASGATAASQLTRLEVALEAAPEGMDPKKVASLARRLHGATREELEADAAELFAEFGGAPKPPTSPTAQRPTPALTSVPVAAGAGATKPDMNDWMRRKAQPS